MDCGAGSKAGSELSGTISLETILLFLAPTGAQEEGKLDLRLSVCVCTLLNTALKKLPNTDSESS